MAYCTDANVEAYLPDAGNFLRSGEADYSGVIATAQRRVDAKLAALGYDVPFGAGAVPELVRDLTALRTCELLILRAPELTDWLKVFRDMAKDIEDGLASGKMQTVDGDSDKVARYRSGGMVRNPHGAPKLTPGRIGRL